MWKFWLFSEEERKSTKKKLALDRPVVVNMIFGKTSKVILEYEKKTITLFTQRLPRNTLGVVALRIICGWDTIGMFQPKEAQLDYCGRLLLFLVITSILARVSINFYFCSTEIITCRTRGTVYGMSRLIYQV